LRKTIVVLSVLVLMGSLASMASANWPDGPNRAEKYLYCRELFAGSFPVINGQVDMVLVGRTILGDQMSVDERVMYIPVNERVRFHAVSLDSNYVVQVRGIATAEPLLDFGVVGGGEGSGQLTRGLGLKEVREIVLLKDGMHRVGHPVRLVPEG
jgi:hypothetical protein